MSAGRRRVRLWCTTPCNSAEFLILLEETKVQCALTGIKFEPNLTGDSYLCALLNIVSLLLCRILGPPIRGVWIRFGFANGHFES